MGCWPQGILPEHFDRLVEHDGGNVVRVPTNTYSIVTPSFGRDTSLASFGRDTSLTSTTICVPGCEALVCVDYCGDMEEHCQKTTMVVIVEAERDGYGSAGHFR